MNRVIINTHRYGDILSNLPIARAWADAGDKVWWCVHEHFADVLNGVSYVTPIVFQGDMNDPEDTERAARSIAPKDAEVICLQAKLLKGRGVSCHRFSAEPWSRAGLLSKFHDLQLLLDRRNTSRDADTVAKHWKNGDRPVMALCLKGYSSNPENCGWGKEGTVDFRQWITFHVRTNLGWDVVDVGELKLKSILDLVPLLGWAVALVSVDTALIHLAYATQTPTLVLSAGTEWDKSEPRHHWIGQFTYSEAMSPVGRERIATTLGKPYPYRFGTMVRPADKMICRKVLHCFDASISADKEIEHCRALARGSWQMINWSAWRPMPIRKPAALFKKVVDSLIVHDRPDDIICFTPSDVALIPEAGEVLAAATEEAGCCFSRIVNLKQVDFMHTRESLPSITGGSVGVIAFTVNWWKGYADQVSEQAVGEPGWDEELLRLMSVCNSRAEIVPAIAYRQQNTAPDQLPEAEEPPQFEGGSIVQVVHVYDASPEEQQRNEGARPTWNAAARADGDWTIVEHTLGNARSSAEIGDRRPVPYIRDLFDFAAKWAADSDILVLANADIHLVPSAGAMIRQAIRRGGCAYAWRITLPAEQLTLDQKKLAAIRTDFGIDLFACSKSWWLAIREQYPDFFLGCTGWDVVMRKLMDRSSPAPAIFPPIYCHAAHESFWKIHRSNPAQVHNQKLWDEWEAVKQWQIPTAI